MFASGIQEANDGSKLHGRTFGCILSRTFQKLRDGDRFYHANKDVVSGSQENEHSKGDVPKVEECEKFARKSIRRIFAWKR